MKRLALSILLFALVGPVASAGIPILEDGKAKVRIVVDHRNTNRTGAEVLDDAGTWLAESLKGASGAAFEITAEAGEAPALIIARADAWPEVARGARLTSSKYDDYAIVTEPSENRVYVLGNSEESARFGVADLLRRWGFRWFAPSPKWHTAPTLSNLEVDLNIVESPQLIERRIWYAYGMSGDDLKPLMLDYQRWAAANRLTLRGLTRTGHSYGNIINRNQEAFESNPALSAMKEDGTRDTTSVPNARKFCVSNPELIDLVAKDRLALLEENRKANPAAFMVSIDPSDGQGTCHCEDCKALGTTTDRALHLANETARRLREADPNAWVGLYAYSSHRLPPTIEVEPNVYVQVALGFNRTRYSLPELVERWSQKVSAIGLREYYGVEAWDWGLPGRARGGRVGYHRKWIPFYAKRNLNGVNAETNANWGAQALGLYVASQLLWDPATEVDPLVDEFLKQLFGEAAETMRGFYEKMEAAPALRPATLIPLFENLQAATEMAEDPAIRARLIDLMAYLVFVAEFRRFDLVRGGNAEHGDAYHDALFALMNYAWRIRHRDIIHYYALARRLCNALPLKDGRPEYSLANKEHAPIWQKDEEYSDAEIVSLFNEALADLEADGDPTIHFSRYFDRVRVPGEDAGAGRVHAADPEKKFAAARFRRGLLGYLGASGPQTARLEIAPTTKPVQVTVYQRDDAIFEKEFPPSPFGDRFHPIAVDLPRAAEYRVEITGEFELRVPPETPFIYEASVTRPAWVDYSGPHYFYVPKGTRELIVDANPRFSVVIPGIGRRDLGPADRAEGKSWIVVKVPEGADGQLWHTTSQTRGEVALLNTPPLFSLHRETVFVPREVSEAEGLSTPDRPKSNR